MKTTKFSYSIIYILLANFVLAQQYTLPSTDLYTLDGEKMSASDISNDGKPLVMVFWRSNEKESCEQLLMINDSYKDYMVYHGVRVVAICIDCVGKIEHVKPFVYGRNLDIEVYIDKNGDFKRSMNILNSPSTILFDHRMQIYCQYAGYCANVEDVLCRKIEKCLAAITTE